MLMVAVYGLVRFSNSRSKLAPIHTMTTAKPKIMRPDSEAPGPRVSRFQNVPSEPVSINFNMALMVLLLVFC